MQEIAPSAYATIRMPASAPLGVPYWLVNTGSASLTVQDHNGTHIISVDPNVSLHLVRGSRWLPALKPNPQFGSVWPALRYTVIVSMSEPNVVLLERAIALGYDGVQPAMVTCRIRTGAAVGTVAQGQFSIDTGTAIGGVSWAPGSSWTLVVENDAACGGWGGNAGRGGVPGTGASTGFAGQNGGTAIRTEIPMRVECIGS
ncbi:MAG: hypothetical protein K8J09_19595, partial [Planctomycetes bacterium]|nr:hypothetical protein [Planctomycetota bacterium]